MAGLIELHGGQPQKQTRYEPIFTNRFFRGLWTQRNPLRDAGSTRYEEKFLGGSADGLIDGHDVEITPRLTLARRSGNSVYNSRTFSAIDQFYSFKLQDGKTIFVMVDASNAVYEATGPSNQNLLGNPVWLKQADGGQMSFQSVLDILYMSDNSQVLNSWGTGIDQKKWVQSPLKWTCGTQYYPDDFIIDPNGNIQRVARVTDLPLGSPESPSQGPNIAQSGVNSGSGVAWTNPQNVSSTLNFATVTTTEASPTNPLAFGTFFAPAWVLFPPPYYVARTIGSLSISPLPPAKITNFHANVPNANAITGISFTFGFESQSPTSAVIETVQLVYQGNPYGQPKTINQTFSNTPGSITVGSSVDQWGAVLTPAIVNDPSFGIQIITTYAGVRLFLFTNINLSVNGSGLLTMTVYSGVASTVASQFLNATNFSFNTISNPLGIVVTLVAQGINLSADATMFAQLTLGGVLIGAPKQFLPSGTASTITLGDITDLWETSGLTSANINNSTFGVAISVTGGGTWSVDNVTITVQTTVGTLLSSVCGSSSILPVTQEPNWSTVWGGTTLDGEPPTQITWICQGSDLENFAIATPSTTIGPSVQNIQLLPTAAVSLKTWIANAWYLPSLIILDNSIPINVQELTVSGNSATTGSSQPVWNTVIGGTTLDNAGGGTAIWTCLGTSVWAVSTSYAIGKIVAVSYTQNNAAHTDFFKCIKAGTSSSAANQVIWLTGFGITVNDGTVIWQNIGTADNWAFIGASQTIANTSIIVDTNGNQQQATDIGKTGATQPTWSLAQNSPTNDNTEVWNNIGPLSVGLYSTATTGAASSLVWEYCYTYRNSLTGDESTASPLSASILIGFNNAVQVSGLMSTDLQVDTIRVYRTVRGGAVPFLLIELPNNGPLVTAGSGTIASEGGVNSPVVFTATTWTFQDTTPDSGLNDLIEAPLDHVNDPPPVGLINMAYHLGRIFGSVGNIVYYSGGLPGTPTNPGNSATAFDPDAYFIYPSKVNKLVPTSSGLWVFTTSEVYIIGGQGTGSSPFYSQPYISKFGLQSFNELDVNGGVIYLRTADNQIMEIQPGTGMSEIGFPIGDQFTTLTTGTGNGFPIGQGYLTWHVAGSTDKAIYMSNGTDGWFRCSVTAAPETGFNWSPKATLVNSGGAKAVQSIEVTPGTYRLLIGPATSGPILMRDFDFIQPSLTGNATGAPIVADNINGEIFLAAQESIVVSSGVANLAVNINLNDTVIVFIADATNSPIIITDDGNNVYTQIGTTVTIDYGTSMITGTPYLRAFATNPYNTNPATHITVTVPAPEELKVLVGSYANCSGIGKYATNIGQSAIPSVTVSPTNPNSLIVAGFSWEPGTVGVEKDSGTVGIAIGM